MCPALPLRAPGVATTLARDACWRVFADTPVAIRTRRHTRVEWPPIHVVVVAEGLHRREASRYDRHWYASTTDDSTSSSLHRRPESVDPLLACTDEWLPAVTVPLWISTIDISLVRRLSVWLMWRVHRPTRLVCAGRTVPSGRGSGGSTMM